MPLPLMPGSEPLPAIKPVPEAPPAEVGNRLAGVGGALVGCSCEACNDMRREFNRLQGNMTGRAVNRTELYAAAYGSSMENIQMQAFAVPVTPFDRSAQEAPQAAGVNAGSIRGRYTQVESDRMHGVRWLDPARGLLYDECGIRSNRVQQDTATGQWSAEISGPWEPTED